VRKNVFSVRKKVFREGKKSVSVRKKVREKKIFSVRKKYFP